MALPGVAIGTALLFSNSVIGDDHNRHQLEEQEEQKLSVKLDKKP